MNPAQVERFARPLTICLFAAAVAVGTLTFRGGVVHATPVTAILQIDVSDGPDAGSWAANWPMPTDPYTWNLRSPLHIFSSTNPSLLLGTIKELSVTLDTDPSVALGFNVEAGGGPTVFTISSLTVNFPALVNPQAFASAAITVTDLDSSLAGATAAGLFPGNSAYQAQYNNGGSVFASLVPPVTATTDRSNTASDRFPASGFTPIFDTVNNIQSQFSFTLTANDSASGTSTFRVVPEPSSLALAIVGASALLRHWRRRQQRPVFLP